MLNISELFLGGVRRPFLNRLISDVSTFKARARRILDISSIFIMAFSFSLKKVYVTFEFSLLCLVVFPDSFLTRYSHISSSGGLLPGNWYSAISLSNSAFFSANKMIPLQKFRNCNDVALGCLEPVRKRLIKDGSTWLSLAISAFVHPKTPKILLHFSAKFKVITSILI